MNQRLALSIFILSLLSTWNVRGDADVSRRAVQIAAGTGFTCALLDDESVKCWGDNSQGQLGIGQSIASMGNAPNQMGTALPRVMLGRSFRARFIAAGSSHVCAINQDGQVKCWGANGAAQLGIGGNDQNRGRTPQSMGDNLPFVNLGTGVRALSLSLGSGMSCAVLSNDSTKCWGAGAPESFTGMGRLRAIGSFANHNCVVTDNSEFKCWGLNDLGQLGQGHVQNLSVRNASELAIIPTIRLGSRAEIFSFQAGDKFTCALNGMGLKCWGDNTEGQLGLGDALPRGMTREQMGETLPFVDLEPGVRAKSFACGIAHCCAILNVGDTLKCWGRNTDGQLGLEDLLSRGGAAAQMGINLPFVDPGTGTRPIQLTSRGDHTCALFDGGRIKCWGKNDLGQLGLGLAVPSVGGRIGEMGNALPYIEL